jgi:hypothetical protein
MRETATARIASAAPRPTIRDLIEIAGRLITVMQEETLALRQLAFARVAELAPEKTKLVDAYTALARDFHKDPETLAAVTKALGDELREVLATFEATARENERTLVAARDANERVLRAVVDAAQVQRPRAQGYGRTGLAVGMGTQRSAVALSVAVDRQL